ncbi:MAG: lipocalin family protein [Clostridia bacterium]|nr:lipocalin family protein [Clostridia bacterium]
MKKTLCIILAVMLLAVSLCACGNSGSSIVGSWSGTTDGFAVTMSFEKDGSGVMSALGGLASESFTYTIEGDTIEVKTSDDDPEVFDFEIDGDTLTLTADDEVMTLTRAK